MRIHRIDHVGINVNDLPAAKKFFIDFGLEMVGEGIVEGQWVDRIIGLHHVKSEVIMLRTQDGDTILELSKFHTPPDENGIQLALANTLGIRHIAFVVDDIETCVSKLKENGAELIGEIENYKNTYKLCYIRGPEGIIIELDQELKESNSNPFEL